MSLLRLKSVSSASARPVQRSLPAQHLRTAVVPRPSLCRQQQCAVQIVPRPAAEGTPAAASTSSGAPEGQMNEALMQAMQAKIQEALEAERVVVGDVYGDGRHVNINVVSAAFEGKNSVQRQRMVYKAIWFELQDAVHAVDSMTTKTPAEAAASS